MDCEAIINDIIEDKSDLKFCNYGSRRICDRLHWSNVNFETEHTHQDRILSYIFAVGALISTFNGNVQLLATGLLKNRWQENHTVQELTYFLDSLCGNSIIK